MLRSSNCGGHRLARAEVDHVERAERDHLRQPELAGRLQPVGAGGEHAADQLVRQLGRRQVEDAGEEAAARERLHRLPARAGGVEDEHLVAELLQPLARPGHRRGRHAEHRRADQRPPSPLSGTLDLRHPGDRAGGVREDPLRDPVQAGDVHDRVGHRDVARADVRPRVPGGDGGDDQLGHADRQRPGIAAAPIEELPEPPTTGSRRAAPPRAGAARPRPRRGTSPPPRRLGRRRRGAPPGRPPRPQPPRRARCRPSICGSKTPASTSSTSTPCSRSRSRR